MLSQLVMIPARVNDQRTLSDLYPWTGPNSHGTTAKLESGIAGLLSIYMTFFWKRKDTLGKVGRPFRDKGYEAE